MEEIFSSLAIDGSELAHQYIAFSRIAVPALAALLLLRCILPLLTFVPIYNRKILSVIL